MIISLTSSITNVHESLHSTCTMDSKRAWSKDTIKSAIGDMFEQMSMSLPIYEETKFFIDKDIKIEWQDINDIFSCTFEENLEDRRVYVNVHKFGLYQIPCRYLMFPSPNMIQ